jgi:hypothetical protein
MSVRFNTGAFKKFAADSEIFHEFVAAEVHFIVSVDVEGHAVA